MKQPIFTGSSAAVITPYKDNLSEVDYSVFEDILKLQIENGTSAVIVCGTTGESPVLSHSEKQMLFKNAVNACGGKIPVIAGTGSNNTEDAVRKANEAEKEGVDGLLIVTPFYNKATQDGIIKHYNYIADRVSTPVIVYNVPSRTGVNIKPQTYKALSEHRMINAVKEAGTDIDAAAQTLSLCADNLNMYSGNDNLTLPLMSLGAKGVISVAANIIPKTMSDICSLCLSGDFNSARELFLQYLELMNMLFCEVNPIPVKYAMKNIALGNGLLRLPLTELRDGNIEKLGNCMKKYGLIAE